MASTKKPSDTPAAKKPAATVKSTAADKPKAPAKAATRAKPAADKPKAPAKAATRTKPAADKPEAPAKAAKAAPARKSAAVASKDTEAAPAKTTAKPAKATGKGKTAAKSSPPAVSPEQRYHYIEVAAYYIAERRGFHGGDAAEDWAEAEQEIDRLLAQGLLNH